MRFLVDENIFPHITAFLRDSGHDVRSIQEDGLFKTTDDEIVRIANKDNRAIITFDKHFGNTLKYPPANTAGIVHIRIHPPLLKDIIPALDKLLKEFENPDFHGRLIVLSKKGYRVKL